MRLCDVDHAATARYLVPSLDLAFCAHHWNKQPQSLKELGFEDYKNQPIPERTINATR